MADQREPRLQSEPPIHGVFGESVAVFTTETHVVLETKGGWLPALTTAFDASNTLALSQALQLAAAELQQRGAE